MTISNNCIKKRCLSGIVYSKNLNGHRDSYVNLMSSIFNLYPEVGDINYGNISSIIRTPILIFASIDDVYIEFLIISIIRSIYGKKTVAIFLRPTQCFEKTKYIYTIKRWVFKVLKRNNNLKILSIIPFDIKPNLAQVAHGWVHDPQLWDTSNSTPIPIKEMYDKILKYADGRMIMTFIGSVKMIKGFKYLTEIFQNDITLKNTILVVVAGKIDSDCTEEAKMLIDLGMLVEDRYVTDSEIETLYCLSDIIWCCYRPDYDQASGIYGRSIQYGKRPIVRAGSILEEYQNITGASHIALPYGQAYEGAMILRNVIDSQTIYTYCTREKIQTWRIEFISRIQAML